jgi:hypothetical protein
VDLHGDSKTGLSKVTENHSGSFRVAGARGGTKRHMSVNGRRRLEYRGVEGGSGRDGDAQHLVLLNTEFGFLGDGRCG